MKRPLTLWFLLVWLLLLALGGLYGGIAMLIDPSGGLLQMTEILPFLPVPNYFLPGLFLLVIMGLFPLLLILGLGFRPTRTLYRRAWAGTICLSIILGIWLAIQGMLIGFQWPIQYITAINGLLILLFAFMPPVRKIGTL